MNAAHALADCTVYVTCASPHGEKLSAAIQAAGGQATHAPRVSIDSFTQTALSLPSNFMPLPLAIFVSVNAVRYGLTKVQAFLSEHELAAQFACIGPSTAAELSHAGVDIDITPDGNYNSEGLLAHPNLQSMQDRWAILVKGVGGRTLLAETLHKRGAIVTQYDCYQREEHPDPVNLVQLQNADMIVCTSAESLQLLYSCENQAIIDCLQGKAICVSSARLAQALQQWGHFPTPILAENATTDAIMAAIVCHWRTRHDKRS